MTTNFQSGYIDEVFGQTGYLSQRFPGYAPREGQLTLTRAVDRAIRESGHLLAEAPTGTGKSLAYAVPAIHHALLRKQRAVIVTANIALQEQLVRKDLPLLKEILPTPFTFALMKGWSNYLCLDRLEEGSPEPPHPDDELLNRHILKWAHETMTGDVSELSFEPPKRLWARYSISSDDCIGKDCERYSRCHPLAARERAFDSDIVVTNYHLFFADMKVREATGGHAQLLPDHQIVIFDEGHKAVDIARDFFGFRLTEGAVARVGSLLPPFEKETLKNVAEKFFTNLLNYRRAGNYKARIKQQNCVDASELKRALTAAESAYLNILDEMPPIETMNAKDRKYAKKIMTRCMRAGQIRTELTQAMRLYRLPQRPWRPHPDNEKDAPPESTWYFSDPSLGGDNSVVNEKQLARYEDVFFIEEDKGAAVLSGKPISVAEKLREKLFSGYASVSVTSATLATNGTFNFAIEELGVQQTAALIAQSPFDWKNQALLVLPQDVPEPNDPRFVAMAAQKCAETIELARGRTLALFTSYKNLNAAHERALRTGYRILRQGDMPRTRLIDEFRKDVNSVLMGVESFWAGVDVPGESLSCVFIDKLPFTTPDDPVMDALQEREREWFMKYSVPRAIIAFKQGFGRLIRTQTDRGVVVVLDRRISTKFYGRHFLASLPPVQQSSDLADVRRFLDGESIGLVAPAKKNAGGSLFDQI